jgi:membrane dipeptidase
MKNSDWPGVYSKNVVIDGLTGAPRSGKFVKELLDAGVTACNWTAAEANETTDTALANISTFFWLQEQLPDNVIIVEKSADILRAKQENKLGVILGFQSGTPIGHNIHLLYIFHRLKVRIIGLTYNEGNLIGSGCTEPSNGGLTSFGIQAIQKMNRLGILVDLSHVGERSSMEAIEISSDPVIFSHSNPRVLQKNPRNISDDQMKTCAEKGGLIGLSVFSAFVGDTSNGRQPTLDELFRQMEYIINFVGIDHVSIGTDIFQDVSEGIYWRATTGTLFPDISQGMTYDTHCIAGFEKHSDYPNVVVEMQKRGYQEEDIRKIIGGNLFRVFAQVWDKGVFIQD